METVPYITRDSLKQLATLVKDRSIEVAVVGISGGTVLLALYGSALVSNAVILAVTTTAGLMFLASKLPKKAQKALVKHSFVTDVTAAVGTYYILGKTVTSLLAAGLVGCMCSMIIWAARPFLLEGEEEGDRPELVLELEII